MKISLNQESYLYEQMKKHVEIEPDDFYPLVQGMELDKYKFLLALCFQGQDDILRQEIKQLQYDLHTTNQNA